MSQTNASPEGSVKPAARGNRRVTVRYRCAPATVGKVFAVDDHEFQRAWILDLSIKGLGMELCRPIEPGHLVLIAVRSNDGKKMHELSARVMNCDPAAKGIWHVGCELLIPLSLDELDQLL